MREGAIALFEALEQTHSTMSRIHVFLDNARYHHAKVVQGWMQRPGRRIVLHFVPSYCPHLNPIERLWKVMHENVTHNKCYAKFRDFADAILGFLRKTVPQRFDEFSSTITDNFRVIDPKEFRILARRRYRSNFLRLLSHTRALHPPARIIVVPWTPPSPYRRREIIQGQGEQSAAARPMRTQARAVLIDALRDAHRWLDELTTDASHTIESIAAREKKTAAMA